MTVEPVRWGVIGCARIATNRVLPAMANVPEARLHAVASRTLVKARETAKDFGAPVAYGSYDELLSDTEVEAIYNPLPNHLHKDWTIAALRAGKHVLCEKPIGLNTAEAREMQAVARETGRILLEAFMYRFSPIFQEALACLRRGEIGEVRELHSAFSFLIGDEPTNVRLRADAGGGALYDVGCYCINVLRMFAGREPTRAWATLSWSDRYGVDMGGMGMLDFGSGLRGTFSTGFMARGDTFCRAVGTEGSLVLPDGFLGRGQEARLLVMRGEQMTETIVPLRDAYELELEDMSLAIRGARKPMFEWEPLDANMRVLDACYRSDRSGCAAEV